MSYATSLPLIARSSRYGGRTAIIEEQGTFSHTDLQGTSSSVASALLAGREDLQEERIAFSITPGFAWVATKWGIWRAGGVAVPLPLNSPRPELEYLIEDSRASTLVCDVSTLPLVSSLAASRSIRALRYDELRPPRTRELQDIRLNVASDRR